MTTRIASRPDGPATRGILYVHSAPSALCPHIEWAVGGVLGVAVSLDWTPQPAQPGVLPCRAVLVRFGRLRGRGGVRAARLEPPALRDHRGADDLHRGHALLLHARPRVFHAVTGLHGDIMIPEDRLKAAVVKAALGDTTLLLEIDKLLGKPWDDELETFRHAGEGAPVRWLHQVV